MNAPTIDIDAFESLRKAIAFSSRDWSLTSSDAWIYGVVVGWGDALPDVAARLGWNEAAVIRLRALRAVFELVYESTPLDWKLMARAIEHAGLPSTLIRTPDGDINNCAVAAGYDERECHVCGGACPDKARFER